MREVNFVRANWTIGGPACGCGIIICIIRYLISLLFISTVRLCVVENPFDTVIHQPAYRRKTPKPTLAIKKKTKKTEKTCYSTIPEQKQSGVIYVLLLLLIFLFWSFPANFFLSPDYVTRYVSLLPHSIRETSFCPWCFLLLFFSLHSCARCVAYILFWKGSSNRKVQNHFKSIISVFSLNAIGE